MFRKRKPKGFRYVRFRPRRGFLAPKNLRFLIWFFAMGVVGALAVAARDPEQSWRQVQAAFESTQRTVWEWIGTSPSQKNSPVIIRGGKVG